MIPPDTFYSALPYFLTTICDLSLPAATDLTLQYAKYRRKDAALQYPRLLGKLPWGFQNHIRSLLELTMYGFLWS